MNFYLIRGIEDEFCNGVILESENYQYGARLAGDDWVDDPARVIPLMIEKNEGKIDTLVAGDNGERKKVTMRKGESGFMEALVMQLRTPLVLFRKGRMIDIDIPERMSLKLWKEFADPDVEVPDYRPL